MYCELDQRDKWLADKKFQRANNRIFGLFLFIMTCIIAGSSHDDFQSFDIVMMLLKMALLGAGYVIGQIIVFIGVQIVPALINYFKGN